MGKTLTKTIKNVLIEITIFCWVFCPFASGSPIRLYFVQCLSKRFSRLVDFNRLYIATSSEWSVIVFIISVTVIFVICLVFVSSFRRVVLQKVQIQSEISWLGCFKAITWLSLVVILLLSNSKVKILSQRRPYYDDPSIIIIKRVISQILWY